MNTEKFFSLLFRNVRKDFKVLFTLKEQGQQKPKQGGRLSPNGNLLPMVEKINKHKLNGYFHCGVDHEQERTLRLRKIDVSGVGFLWVDIDKQLTPLEIEKIQKDEFRPTLMVSSGNGYHLYWILQAFEYDKEAATEANR